MKKIEFISLIPAEIQKNNGVMEFSCIEIHYTDNDVETVPLSFANFNTEDDSLNEFCSEIAKKYNIPATSVYVEYGK